MPAGGVGVAAGGVAGAAGGVAVTGGGVCAAGGGAAVVEGGVAVESGLDLPAQATPTMAAATDAASNALLIISTPLVSAITCGPA